MAKRNHPSLEVEHSALLERNKFLLFSHQNRAVGTHDHSFLELSYIQEGIVEHNLDGQITLLYPGDYIIVDYGSRHSYRSIGAEFYINWDCIFLPELLDSVLRGTKSLRVVLEHYLLRFNPQALVQNPARTIFHDSTGRVRVLLEQMIEETKDKKAGYTEIVRCYLIEILIITMRQLEGAQTAAVGQDISAFLIAYVADHYMEQITLQDLASRLNYSLPYVSKKFKEDVGVSFVHYLQNYRIMQGCRLLSNSRKTISEITEMVGYHDVKFFSTLLKRTTGLSPADYRRQYRK